MKRIACLIILISLPAFPSLAQSRGIEGKQAPSWKVNKWHNLPEGKGKLNVSDFKGKTLYLYCFQSWCPGCHSRGFPTLKAVSEEFKGNDRVAFVVIQTVFEGFKSNTFDRGKQVMKKFSLDMPMGQSGENGKRSELMGTYRTGGTPWVIIIGQDGKVIYNAFHIDKAAAIDLIKRQSVEKKEKKED